MEEKGDKNGRPLGIPDDIEVIEIIETSNIQQPIPDGGFVAWTQCASSFCLFMSTWGITNSFGVFQTYYEERFPQLSASEISWIGSVQLSLLIGLGVVTGPFYDHGYLRSLLAIGSFFAVFGMMMTSISTEYWHLVLSQGILNGFGAGLLFIPSIAVLPTYFKKRQSLAIGLGASGSALGAIIFSIILGQLQPRIGFGWTIRIIAFIMLLLLTLPVLAMRMRNKPSEARKIFDVKAWTEPPFILTSIFLFLAFLTAYIPTFYIQVYGLQNGFINARLSFYLVPLLNTGSLFGRIIVSHIADQMGVLNTEVICIIITSLLAFIWISVRNTTGLILFAIVYGFFSGAITTLSPNIAVFLSPDPGLLGVRMGMLLIPIALGLLIGNPIAGAISTHGWNGLQSFTGGVLVISAGFIIAVRVVMHGWYWKKKC